MNAKLLPAAWLLMVASAGCADAGPTGASQDAMTEVQLTGDAPQGGSASHSASPEGGSAEMEGTVRVAARVYLQSTAGRWTEVTGGVAAEQTVDAAGADGFRLLARGQIEAGAYRRIRIEFEEVRADVNGALALQLGSGLVSVEVGSSGAVVVERAIDLRAGAASESRVNVDLNAPEWIDSADSGGHVARGAFESAVHVTAQ